MLSLIFLTIIVILVVGFLIWLGYRGGTRVNQYFYNAVKTWLEHHDENARLAALAAAKVASPKAQKDYDFKLQAMRFELMTKEKPTQEEQRRARLLLDLVHEIREKEWTTEDAKKERLLLYQKDQEYATALNKFDDKVFAKRYSEKNFPQTNF